MRHSGRARLLVIIALTFAAATGSAQAGGYVLSIVGNGSTFPDLDPGPLWGAMPGGTFQVNAVLSDPGSPGPPSTHNSATFDVGVTGPRSLIYNTYLWDPVYTTGGPNDSSVPKVDPNTGLLPGGIKPLIDNLLYPNTPNRADVHLANAVTVPGQTFGYGTLVTLTMKIPAGAQVGEQFVIAPFPGKFVSGASLTPIGTGTSLGVVVVPEPATLVLLGLGGLAAFRRRLFGA